MRANVYTDKVLASRAGQFVWLSIDTEKAANGAVLEKYPVTVWPSMFVIDPRTEKVLVRWTGGATIAQLERLLDAGRRQFHPPADRGAGELAAADALYGSARYAEAATAYAALLSSAPRGWKELPRVVDAYLFALSSTDQNLACAEAARRYFPQLATTPSAPNVAAVGLDCATGIAKEEHGRGALIAALERDAHAVLADHRLKIAGDDRSGVYESLVSAREDAGDEAGHKRLLAEWIAFLEGAAAAAKTPDARAVFDSHRVTAYLAAGEPQRAIPMLEASERDLPDDYNPPARLALALKAMGDYGRALGASDRALAKAYGPRRLSILRTRADIYEAKGDLAAARTTIQQALAEAAALPAGQRNPRVVEALQKRLAKLPATAPSS